MKARCSNKNIPNYRNYGARGISVCHEWINDFTSFYTWAIENGYTDELSIERINNNGNYEPSNCKWATNQEQAHNKRKTKSMNKYIGVYKHQDGFIAKLSIKGIVKHIGSFKTEINAAIARNNYIDENNLEHKKNIIEEIA